MTEPYTTGIYAEMARLIWPGEHIGLHLDHCRAIKAIHINPDRAFALMSKAERAAVLAALEEYERRRVEDSGA